MSAPILNVRDILSGEQGEAYAVFEDGRIMNLMQLKNIEATVEFDKEQVPILGKRGKGNRKKGETYSGSMTVYYVTTEFRKLAQVYKNDGKDFYFNIQIVNEDKTTNTGKQIITLEECNIDSLVLTKLDADSTILDEDMDFTFENYRIEQEFDTLNGLWVKETAEPGTVTP